LLLFAKLNVSSLHAALLVLQELMYVEKLVARRRILGLDVPQPDAQQQQQQPGTAAAAAGKKRQRQDDEDDAEDAADADATAAAAAEEDGEGPEDAEEREAAAAEAPDNLLLTQQQQQQGASQPDTPQDFSQDPQAAVRAVLTGAVAKLVFQNALKAAASSKGGSSNYLKSPAAAAAAAAAGSGKGLGFRAGFLEVLGRYKSPGVAALKQEVLDSIRRDFKEVRPGTTSFVTGFTVCIRDDLCV
jgi:hypothetical protein